MGPPATSADRTRKFVDKLKLTGNYDAFKQKRADYERARRERVKASLAKLTDSQRLQALRKSRLMSLARVQKHRERKKRNSLTSEPYSTEDEPIVTSEQDALADSDNDESNFVKTQTAPKTHRPKNSSHVRAGAATPEMYQPKPSRVQLNFEQSYNTYSALAKAVSKAKKALPTSPNKRKAVIAKLIYDLDEQSQMEIFNNKAKTKRTGHNRIGSTLVHEIHKFYERDDISRMSTNENDVTNYVNPFTGEERLAQLRYLVYTLKQAFDLFMKENVNATVKLAKFCSLRPAHVKLCKKDYADTNKLQLD